MTDKFLAQQIAVLGRLCGIMPGFQDNEGKRHRTSQATYKALLTTMGVPWDNPDVLRMEIERRQVHLFDRLLQPVTAISSASAGNELTVLVRTSGPEEPASLPAWAEIRAKKGGRWEVEGFLTTPSKPHRHPVTGGFRSAMTLALPEGLEPGYYEVTVKLKGREGEDVGEALLVAAPETAYQPPFLAGGRRLWGFNLPLYALTGSRNWGMGDFTNLREMIAWAGDLGAAFVGVNPLHAPPPLARDDLSPYSPTSRMLLSFLYLDLEKVPELAESSAAQALLADPEFQAAKARACAAPLVAYAEVFRLKRRLLGPLFDTFWARHGGEEPATPRGQEFARFRGSADESLQKFAEFAALAEHWGESDWRRWPPEYHHPGSRAVAGFVHKHRREVLFHQFVQWLASTQLDQAKEQAYQAGVPFTLYQDLALGAISGGFETWAYPGLFAQGAAIGAPPDAFNPKGQDWGLPPMIPERLLDLKFQPFINTLRANLPVDGMLRLDHVMALFRLFWIPHTEPKTAGAYVNYPARELLAILAMESQRRRTLIIGEDLGTVAPHIRRQLRKQGILSYRVFYFERRRDGGFREPEDYPRQAMAAVTTHDLPTLAGFWEGRDIQVRQALNLYPKEQMAANDVRDRKQDRKNLLNALERQRLLPQVRPAELAAARTCPEEVRLGILEYLGQSAAALVEIRLEDVFGAVEQQNLPGTITEYPNWKHKIPLSLAQMRATPEPRDLAHRMTRCSRNSKTKDHGNSHMPEAALIYNLFPPLVGSIPHWEEHLDRIAAMGFNWVFLNPIHPPGLSGSLYAVKDYFSINSLFYPESGEDPEAALVHFLKAAERRGLKVMLDLVINHTAIDSPLVEQHPEWYARDEDGSIKNPGAIDPGDPSKVTIWGDLAELAYWPVPDPEGLLHFWDAVVSKYLGLGFLGFRADAAYKIPGWFWRRLIEEARSLVPQVQFFAETLGCRLEELAQLSDAGFDYICNSSKWWDFQEDWCLEQYNRFRRVAPSISFPETHDTDRLARESGGDAAVARQRYLFAAFFSTGLMIPVGFELGFTKHLHVVKTQPEDWETPTYDLTNFIAQVNRMKLACPVLLEEGPMARMSPKGKPVVILVKSRDKGKGRVLAVINTSRKAQKANVPNLADCLGEPAAAWQDLTPEAPPRKFQKTQTLALAPAEINIFYNPQGESLAVKRAGKK